MTGPSGAQWIGWFGMTILLAGALRDAFGRVWMAVKIAWSRRKGGGA